jgi:hydrogenase/urease accessory protein HupE
VRLAALVRQWSPIAADGSGDRAAGTHGSRFVRGPVPPLWRIDKLWDVGAVGIYASLTSLGRIR